ncbi:MAG: EI24 domain-containing protein [Bdellovibrionales bacterium]|nr:EI24 domain-containing protein [Bdellovibrionales bacterium]
MNGTKKNDFVGGLKLSLTGYLFLKKNPSLWKWILIPWIISALSLILGWIWGFKKVPGWTHHFLQLFNSWIPESLTPWIQVPLNLIVGLLFFMVWFYLILAFSSLVSSPFLGILAERTLQLQKTTLPFSKRLSSRIYFIIKMLWVSLLKLIIFSFCALILLIFSLLPGINLIISFLFLLLLSADIFDYSFEALGYNIQQRLHLWRQLRMELTGTSVFLTLTSLIPGFTVIFIPLAVIGAANLLAFKLKMENQ